MGSCQSTDSTASQPPAVAASHKSLPAAGKQEHSHQPSKQTTAATAKGGATLDLGLQGKLVIVTGSTKGIGYAIASGFARHGALVVVNGRAQAAADAAVASIAKATGAPASRLFAIAGDLGKKADCDAFIAKVDAIGVPVEVLVNNHGIFDLKPFADETDEEWQRYYDVNVLSQVRLSRHYLPKMLERKTGRVLFSSSGVAVMPFANAVAYSVSKAEQVALARALAELTKGTEVTVNSVLIGPVSSDGANAMYEEKAAAAGITADQLVQGMLSSMASYSLTRLQTVDEMANIFLFLASKQGLLINGTAQHADSACIRHI